MKIAVLSDIHDNLVNFDQAIRLIKLQNCEAIIFCGDFCAPFTAEKFVQLKLPIYAIFGNNDGDQYSIAQVLSQSDFKLWPPRKEFAEIELDKHKIAFTHYPKLGKLLATTSDYQAVFHGHTHLSYQEQIGSTLLANPGSVCGLVSGLPSPASFGVYNTSDMTFTIIPI